LSAARQIPNSVARETRSGDFRSSKPEEVLKCEIAALHMEINALHKFMEWQSRRINELEHKLLGAKKHGNVR
jgi:hypothetical protein